MKKCFEWILFTRAYSKVFAPKYGISGLLALSVIRTDLILIDMNIRLTSAESLAKILYCISTVNDCFTL